MSSVLTNNISINGPGSFDQFQTSLLLPDFDETAVLIYSIVLSSSFPFAINSKQNKNN